VLSHRSTAGSPAGVDSLSSTMLVFLTKALQRINGAESHVQLATASQRFISYSRSAFAENSSKDVPFSTVNLDRDPTYKSEIQGHSDDRGNAPITGQGRTTTSYDVVDPSGPDTAHSIHTIDQEGISSGPG
jgi:hypothetical protein